MPSCNRFARTQTLYGRDETTVLRMRVHNLYHDNRSFQFCSQLRLSRGSEVSLSVPWVYYWLTGVCSCLQSERIPWTIPKILTSSTEWLAPTLRYVLGYMMTLVVDLAWSYSYPNSSCSVLISFHWFARRWQLLSHWHFSPCTQFGLLAHYTAPLILSSCSHFIRWCTSYPN